MAKENLKVVDTDELTKQRTYANDLAASGFDWDIAVGAAFVESMRNTYYRHTGTALDEIIDNAIEAGAGNIHVALGYGRESDKKPNAIAVIDDGHGMEPDMVRLSVIWGGTHRLNSRRGFGRFGFGLPTASVNQARRYSVYSITSGGEWSGLTIDLDDIRDGKYTDPDTRRLVVPSPKHQAPPKWILDYIKKQMAEKKLEHGTVIIWEKLDRIKWTTASGMAKNLLQHFGVTYRNYLGSVKLCFDGTPVQPTDPLFITPGYRFYDFDEDRATPLEPAEFEVTSKETGKKVKVRIRYSRMPLSFFRVDKTKGARGKNQNPRFSVAVENTGIIVCRLGRQIDTIEHTPWPDFEKFQPDDRLWAAEIDFPAELDEELTVSNAKQGVVLSDSFWDQLKNAGMDSALLQLRRSVRADQKAQATKKEDPGEKRASEKAMEESETFKRSRADADPVEREKKAKEALEQHVKRKARESERSEEDVRREVEQEILKHPYRVQFEVMPGAPFFRVEQVGGMQVLYINQSNRFFSDIYAAPESTRGMRAALEVLLFSIGDCELDAQGNVDRAMFYAVERQAWTERLTVALEILDQFVHNTSVEDIEPPVEGAA